MRNRCRLTHQSGEPQNLNLSQYDFPELFSMHGFCMLNCTEGLLTEFTDKAISQNVRLLGGLLTTFLNSPPRMVAAGRLVERGLKPAAIQLQLQKHAGCGLPCAAVSPGIQ
jgi:hypothetical protein